MPGSISRWTKRQCATRILPLCCFLSLSKAYITSIHHPTFSDVPQTSVLLKSAITSLVQRNRNIMEEFIWNCRVNSLYRDYNAQVTTYLGDTYLNLTAAAIPCSPTVQQSRQCNKVTFFGYGHELSSRICVYYHRVHSSLTPPFDISSLSCGT